MRKIENLAAIVVVTEKSATGARSDGGDTHTYTRTYTHTDWQIDKLEDCEIWLKMVGGKEGDIGVPF